MSRLINAEEIKFVSDDDHYDFAYKSDIDALPTIEAEPVVHAHWDFERVELYKAYYPPDNQTKKMVNVARCSKCYNKVIYDNAEELKDYNYCSWCGAKMDEASE